MRNIICTILGIVGFVLCLNEQPPSESQNWWVNLIGIGLFASAAFIFVKCGGGKR